MSDTDHIPLLKSGQGRSEFDGAGVILLGGVLLLIALVILVAWLLDRTP